MIPPILALGFSPEMRSTFIGVFAVLIVASLIGAVLAKRARSRPEMRATVENLNARIHAWWIMSTVLGVCLILGFRANVLIFAFISFLALREFVTATPAALGDHGALFWVFFIILPLQYAVVWVRWYGFFIIVIPIYAFIFLPVRCVFAGETRDFLSRCARMQWGLMVCVFFISHLPMLLTLPIPSLAGKEAQLILFLVIVVQGSDVLQYVWGKLCGRHKLAPVLSPSKTWEGFLGGVLSASLLGMALHFLTPMRPWQAFVVSLVLTLAGFFGGLVMSAIKRDRGIKDWGQMIEGHGGMMDRIDSLCFSAPLFFHILRFWWT